ncbi:MAG: cytochrome ubiquinol oxidase subunit I [Fervidicoccaceae archaeon]
MSIESLSFVLLGLSVLIHILFVTADLGSGIIAALTRTLSYKEGSETWEIISKRLFRFMIITELFSGVWGTIITVFLAGFFGGLVALATNVLFVPIAISIASIMIRIPSIAASWYLWNRISPKKHVILMWVMAISGYGIPAGFRTIFAELNYPYAVESYLSGIPFSSFMPFSNPVYWYLMMHTVLASISVGGYILATISSIEKDTRITKYGIKIGLSFAILQSFAGMIYYISLRSYSMLLFDLINSSTLPIFAVKLILVGVLLYISLEGLIFNEGGVKTWIMAPLSLLIVVFGEALNDGSRYPYLIISGNSGISMDSFFNYLMPIPVDAISVVMLFFIVGIATFSLAMYYGLVKRYVTEPS